MVSNGGVGLMGGGGDLQLPGALGMNGQTFGAGYMAPLFDTIQMASYLSEKRQTFIGDLTYKVTKGPGDTRLIHLMNLPGNNKYSFGFSGAQGSMYGLVGSYVWYTYYDNVINVDDCRKRNPDILLTPDQVPLENMPFEFLNTPTQTIVRNLLIAAAGMSIVFVRPKNEDGRSVKSKT
ncbi:MAG: hypothetical protein EZS28_019545 [Streblomastix strix]|uniref:Uncharacterized protein n=1 Tax=Streblomastix strix TaxID=222440 RepID=A0A5J4VR60_9EUKA|nr:MAG: hypothetical protein EZS28_019545 [Streblomastix strix]